MVQPVVLVKILCALLTLSIPARLVAVAAVRVQQEIAAAWEHSLEVDQVLVMPLVEAVVHQDTGRVEQAAILVLKVKPPAMWEGVPVH